MGTNQLKGDDEKKRSYVKIPGDETLKPISAEDLIAPQEELQETSARREWQIKKLQEQLGVSREIAEKMVDETGRSL